MDKPVVLTREQRLELIEEVKGAATELAEDITWRTDPRLEQAWTTKGWSKVLKLRMKVRGMKFSCLVNNEGDLLGTAGSGQVSRPLNLSYLSEVALMAIRDTLAATPAMVPQEDA